MSPKLEKLQHLCANHNVRNHVLILITYFYTKYHLMKPFLCVLLLVLSQLCYGTGSTFEELAAINSYWNCQNDLDKITIPKHKERSDNEWIKIHLSLVEKVLSSRDVSHLTIEQRKNRTAALLHLNEYWHAGNFPINNKTNYRTPIFIDDFDNFCAVGYLIKATGYEQISRKVAAEKNLAYVRELDYPELLNWAHEYGFTKAELAWIQPTYPPHQSVYGIGFKQNPNDEVLELFADTKDEKLYFGGVFTKVDTVDVKHIGYLTEVQGKYTLHTMGDGIDGDVHAIAEYQNKIFAGGDFSSASGIVADNIAYWDSTKWRYAGCLRGVVKDMIVHNGKLYACGDFKDCASSTESNFAVWNGSGWTSIYGLTGYVNTLHSTDNELILGGAFKYQNTSTNIIKWDQNNSFSTYNNTIPREVMDVELFDSILRLACKGVSAKDSNLFYSLNNNTWTSNTSPTDNSLQHLSYNTLCAYSIMQYKFLFAGGTFQLYTNGPKVTEYNVAEVTNSYSGRLNVLKNIGVDSTINKLVLFKGIIFGGGKFKQAAVSSNVQYLFRSGASYTQPPPPKDTTKYEDPNMNGNTNSTAVKLYPTHTAQKVYEGNNKVIIYPNPANKSITIENCEDATSVSIYNMNGQRMSIIELSSEPLQKIKLPDLTSGLYSIEILNKNGTRIRQKLTIQK